MEPVPPLELAPGLSQAADDHALGPSALQTSKFGVSTAPKISLYPKEALRSCQLIWPSEMRFGEYWQMGRNMGCEGTSGAIKVTLPSGLNVINDNFVGDLISIYRGFVPNDSVLLVELKLHVAWSQQCWWRLVRKLRKRVAVFPSWKTTFLFLDRNVIPMSRISGSLKLNWALASRFSWVCWLPKAILWCSRYCSNQFSVFSRL